LRFEQGGVHSSRRAGRNVWLSIRLHFQSSTRHRHSPSAGRPDWWLCWVRHIARADGLQPTDAVIVLTTSFRQKRTIRECSQSAARSGWSQKTQKADAVVGPSCSASWGEVYRLPPVLCCIDGTSRPRPYCGAPECGSVVASAFFCAPHSRGGEIRIARTGSTRNGTPGSRPGGWSCLQPRRFIGSPTADGCEPRLDRFTKSNGDAACGHSTDRIVFKMPRWAVRSVDNE
jgi:hypothetical protein